MELYTEDDMLALQYSEDDVRPSRDYFKRLRRARFSEDYRTSVLDFAREHGNKAARLKYQVEERTLRYWAKAAAEKEARGGKRKPRSSGRMAAASTLMDMSQQPQQQQHGAGVLAGLADVEEHLVQSVQVVTTPDGGQIVTIVKAPAQATEHVEADSSGIGVDVVAAEEEPCSSTSALSMPTTSALSHQEEVLCKPLRRGRGRPKKSEEGETTVLLEEGSGVAKIVKKAWSLQQKREAIRFALEYGNTEATKRFGIDEGSIRYWKKKLYALFTEEEINIELAPHIRRQQEVEKPTYTKEFRLMTVEFAERHGNAAASRMSGMNEATIRYWKKNKKRLFDEEAQRVSSTSNDESTHVIHVTPGGAEGGEFSFQEDDIYVQEEDEEQTEPQYIQIMLGDEELGDLQQGQIIQLAIGDESGDGNIQLVYQPNETSTEVEDQEAVLMVTAADEGSLKVEKDDL